MIKRLKYILAFGIIFVAVGTVSAQCTLTKVAEKGNTQLQSPDIYLYKHTGKNYEAIGLEYVEINKATTVEKILQVNYTGTARVPAKYLQLTFDDATKLLLQLVFTGNVKTDHPRLISRKYSAALSGRHIGEISSKKVSSAGILSVTMRKLAGMPFANAEQLQQLLNCDKVH